MKLLKKNVYLILLALVAVLLFLLSNDQGLVERYYSSWFYKIAMTPISRLFGMIPFSVAEVVVVLFFVGITATALSIFPILLYYPGNRTSHLIKLGKNFAIILLSLFICFQLMWGLNYSRSAFSDLAGIHISPSDVDDLYELCLDLTEKASLLRKNLDEDSLGSFELTSGIDDMFARTQSGFDLISSAYPQLSGDFGTPKKVFLSRYWSYTGTSGMYFPLTGEANINTNIPDYMLPSTTVHEMAHQRGFAREDEANFISYLVCKSHPDVDFQYSGTMLALGYSMSQLNYYSPEKWQVVRSKYSEGMNRDIDSYVEYRNKYNGKVWEFSNKTNNSYLVLNRQSDGIRSYGRMVDLLLAYERGVNPTKTLQ
ncbi:DUF3810 domain-containing protein [Alkalibacter mobilis]|uniref:DUF3810 domain-containing protein n=1 Tax=Alkalibacter mobilis TaxID=2787712 RepID=UPI0018A0BF76|nr:DUF3810 domain-containing protein [Alkalibacter mobilis]MBF7097788.1 DUF3810 domain-containing protein [Alkalibacter mobilis]